MIDKKKKYKLGDFNYQLPKAFIAQHPESRRDYAKLMVVHRDSGEIEHKKFYNITDYMRKNDLLVLNNTKVFPARLFATKDRTEAKVEVFLLRELSNDLWEVMVRPARKVRIGNKLVFTPKLMCDVSDNTVSGGRVVNVTLHIGLGTFRPVQVEDLNRHQMDSEYFEVSPDTAMAINQARKRHRKIIAVGTSTVRALETIAISGFQVTPKRGWTDKFIYPPYEYKMVDKMITNFHTPQSTLLMMVSAFAGRKLIKKAYLEAKRNKYRFLSYGDAMLII